MIFILPEIGGLCDFLLVININLGLISRCLATIQPQYTEHVLYTVIQQPWVVTHGRTDGQQTYRACQRLGLQQRVKNKEFASGGQSSIPQTVGLLDAA